MSSQRKDDHIKLALQQKEKTNAFDRIFLASTDLPDLAIDDIDLSTTYLGFNIKYPIYINAMTGGSKKGYEINDFLSRIANHFGLPFVTGSQSVAFKDPSVVDSFKIVRQNHQGIVIGNLNANANLKQAKAAVEMIDANGLSIHLNVIQELVMPEGDRDFSSWTKHIQEISSGLNLPVVVKQVGMGLSNITIEKLQSIGIRHIDVAGSGGTSFLDIESKRGNKSYDYLSEFSLDTASILIDLKNKEDISVYASGGIRHPLDVIKSLVLGAKAAGLSRWFLNLVELDFDKAISEVEDFILDLKKIMIILGARNIEALKKVSYEVK